MKNFKVKLKAVMYTLLALVVIITSLLFLAANFDFAVVANAIAGFCIGYTLADMVHSLYKIIYSKLDKDDFENWIDSFHSNK